jgi:DeoD family purine-nucleoside phosphorylase
MPIHLRAEPGAYANAVLCPGDPLRAEYIARTFFADARQVNGERGMLGFTGTFEGRPVSVQATGMGAPSAAIVFEELVQLGARVLIRVGTCGALQPELALGDTIVAVSATAQDGTVSTYTNGDPHAPTASWELVESAVALARARGQRVHVGPIVSNDIFYDPYPERQKRFASRGHLAVEMEAAVLYTIAAMRGVRAVTILTVSDTLENDVFIRITDDELRRGVDAMTELAIRVAVGA